MANKKKSSKPEQKKIEKKIEAPAGRKFNVALKELTPTQLCLLTGKSYRTIADKLLRVKEVRKDANSIYYNPREALEAIYESDANRDWDKDESRLLKEKLKSETYRAEKARMEVEILRKEVLRIDVVERVWINLLTKFRARILTAPSKVSLEVLGLKDVHKIERRLTEEAHEALNELKEFKIEDYIDGVVDEDGASDSAAAETNSK